MAMARVIFFIATCVAFAIRDIGEANPASLVQDASIADLVMDDLDDMEEKTSSPVTPRRDDLHYELLGDSLMMEAESTNETETCGTGKPTYEITGKLGEGSFGTVYKVRTLKGENYQDFALKVPSPGNKGAERNNVKEMNTMGNVHCTHVLPLVEKAPCVSEQGQLSTAFVTKLLPGDLKKWSKDASKSKKLKCISKIFDGIHSGLECLHKAGYVHGDIKADNILYSDLDGDGCPKDIILADFGLSHKVGAQLRKLERDWWMRSYHVPQTMFEGKYDPLNLTTVEEDFHGEYHAVVTAKPVLDWCSVAFVLRKLEPDSYPDPISKSKSLFTKIREKAGFSNSEKTLQPQDLQLAVQDLRDKVGGASACGMMGPGRKWSMP